MMILVKIKNLKAFQSDKWLHIIRIENQTPPSPQKKANLPYALIFIYLSAIFYQYLLPLLLLLLQEPSPLVLFFCYMSFIFWVDDGFLNSMALSVFTIIQDG